VKDTFTGWRGDFQGFFVGLQANNSKAYLESHRRQYEEEVKRPMVALLADLEPEFGPARLSRPNRDSGRGGSSARNPSLLLVHAFASLKAIDRARNSSREEPSGCRKSARQAVSASSTSDRYPRQGARPMVMWYLRSLQTALRARRTSGPALARVSRFAGPVPR
jgi:Conserved hypothetical protein (DUF2461)